MDHIWEIQMLNGLNKSYLSVTEDCDLDLGNWKYSPSVIVRKVLGKWIIRRNANKKGAQKEMVAVGTEKESQIRKMLRFSCWSRNLILRTQGLYHGVVRKNPWFFALGLKTWMRWATLGRENYWGGESKLIVNMLYLRKLQGIYLLNICNMKGTGQSSITDLKRQNINPYFK